MGTEQDLLQNKEPMHLHFYPEQSQIQEYLNQYASESWKYVTQQIFET